MHLFTRLRTKCALLLLGAVLWSGTAWAETKTVASWNFVNSFTTNRDAVTTEGTVTINKISCSVGTGTFEGLAFQGSWMYYDSPSNCLYSMNNGVRTLGILNLQANDVVSVSAYQDLSSIDIVNGSHATSSEDGIYKFTVTADGTIGLRVVNYAKIYSILVTREVADDAVNDPTIAVEGNDYASQLITLAQEDGATIQYTLNGGDTLTYENAFRVFETTEIKAWAVSGEKESNPVTKTVKACIVATPALSVAINSNDVVLTSSLDGAEIYTANESDSTLYESAISLTETTAITYWATYSETIDDVEYRYNSAKTTVTVPVHDALSMINTLDLTPSAFSVTSDYTNTSDTEVLLTENSISFSAYKVNTKQINGLYVQTGSKWMVRPRNAFYLFDSSKRILIPNVKEGQVVELVGGRGQNEAFVLTAELNGSIDNARSVTDSKYVFECTGDGNLVLLLNRYGYIQTINIYGSEPITTTATLNSATNIGTFYWSRMVEIPEGVQAFTGTLNEDNTEFTLAEVSEKIPANTPVILYAPEKTSVEFTAVDGAVDAIKNDLQGKLVATATSTVAGDDNTVWVISNTEENGFGFYKYSGETIVANKAYLVLPTATSDSSDEDQDLGEEAPTIRLPFGTTLGNVTAIESIKAEAPAVKGIYDLQGRRVMNATRGLYIMDGKKVLVK